MTCPEKILPNQDAGWLGREPTIDEQEVVDWLRPRVRPSARILHVGVGNCLVSRMIPLARVQGLTRDGAEASEADRKGVNTLLCNKYDVPSYSQKLEAPFDYIVDVNVRSYACCDTHFAEFMYLMWNGLAPGGRLITSVRGLEYRVPTTLEDLEQLNPRWKVRRSGNVVSMTPVTSRFNLGRSRLFSGFTRGR